MRPKVKKYVIKYIPITKGCIFSYKETLNNKRIKNLRLIQIFIFKNLI